MRKGSMKKGSITVYLALTFTVLLSLVFVCIESARFACGRTVLSAGIDEGLFSLFAEYDRTLYEKYGLLFIDSGFGTAEADLGSLLEEVYDTAKSVVTPEKVLDMGEKNLFRIRFTERAVSGVLLATDNGYQPLKEQIYFLMGQKKGVDAVTALFEGLTSSADLIRAAEEGEKEDLEALLAEYERQKQAEPEKPQEETEVLPSGQGKTAVPPGFKNPIENIMKLQQLGIYAFIFADREALSTERIDKSALIGRRDIRTGFGSFAEKEKLPGEKYMLIEYLLDFFPNYLTAEKTKGLQYQAEYAIAEQSRDVDNLKSVMNRLMVIREVFNMLYLNTDPVKKAECFETALIISAVLLIPEAAPFISEVLMACWAFGEGLLDLQSLYHGKSVPLVKDNETWQLSIEGAAELTKDTVSNGKGRGLTYKDYLRILLMLKTEKRLTESIAGLLEYNKRAIDGLSGFCLDNCVAALEAEFSGTIGSFPFTIVRSYAYDTR